MKTNFLPLLFVAVLPVIAGCAQAISASEDQATTTATTASNTAAPAAIAGSPATNPAPAIISPGKVVNVAPVIPDNVKLTPAAAELARLAQAGISPSVMRAYVTNSVNTFNLSAEEIVYLNDLGLAPEVVSAMIQQDQRIREASLQGAVAASPATPLNNPPVWSAGPPEPANVWQQNVSEPAPVASGETPTAAPPPPEALPDAATVDYFYGELASYGTWIDVAGYGRVWRPTVAASVNGWQPYQDGGRWVWTDYGWYWYSDYTWGWAPFHYGRWFTHPNWGWCWVPGSVWGPSWVTWRYTDAYAGWAPLPPAAYYTSGIGITYYGGSVGVSFGFGLPWNSYTYVAYNNFCGGYYNHHHAPKHETPHIHNSSIVANNIIVGNNNTIINQGISPDRVTAATRNEVPRVAVREGRGSRFGRQEQLSPDGRALTVTRNVVPGTTMGSPGRGSREQAAVTPAATPEVTTPVVGGPARTEAARDPARNPRAGQSSFAGSATNPRGITSPPQVTRAPVRETSAAPAPGRNETPETAPTIGGTNDRNIPAAAAPKSGGTAPRIISGNGRNIVANESPGGRTIIINTRTGRPVSQNTAISANPVAPNTSATPWVKNAPTTSPAATPATSAQTVAPAPSATIVRESRTQPVPRNSPISQPTSPGTPRTIFSSNSRTLPANGPIRYAPQVTPQPSAPQIQSFPTRTYGASAPPQPPQTYTPAVPSAAPRINNPQSTMRNSSPPARVSEARSVPPAPATAPAPPSPPPSSSTGRTAPSSGNSNSRSPGNR